VEGKTQRVESGLAAGESRSLWFEGSNSHTEETHAIVDYHDEVRESNEANNSRQERVPVPTLPVQCTSTPSPTPSMTPYPPSSSGTPTPEF
jgi:subtilase family serine protease